MKTLNMLKINQFDLENHKKGKICKKIEEKKNRTTIFF